MNGNINQYGDFDQCIDAISPDQKIQGKYCLSLLKPRSKEMELEILRKAIQNHEFVKNDIDDVCNKILLLDIHCQFKKNIKPINIFVFQPFHVNSRLSTVVWGFCVPSACSNEDLEIGLKNSLLDFTKSSGLEFEVRVREDSCYVKETNWKQNLSSVNIITMQVLILSLSKQFKNQVYSPQIIFPHHIFIGSFINDL